MSEVPDAMQMGAAHIGAWDIDEYNKPEGPYGESNWKPSPRGDKPKPVTQESHPGWGYDESGRLHQPEHGDDPYARRQEPGKQYHPVASAYTDRMFGPGMDPDAARAVAPAVGGPGKSTHQQPPGLELDPDRLKDNMIQAQVQKLFLRYVGFCRRNRLPLTLSALERHGKRLSPSDYLVVAIGLNKLARRTAGELEIPHHIPSQIEIMHRAKGGDQDAIDAIQRLHPESWMQKALQDENWGSTPEGPKDFHFGRDRTAAPDYLQKATEALTNLLNQKAEDFQSGIAPLQQALQVVQQSQAIEQANNPLSVQPPAGTVNVLPDPPGGGGGLPGDPAAAGGMADQSAPPPAAGGGGLPTDQPIGPDPQQMSARRRVAGEYPSEDPAQHYADWHEFQGLNLADHPRHLREYAHETAATPDEVNRIRQVHGDRGGHPKGRRPAKVRG